MRISLNANAALISLIILSSIFAFLFLEKEQLFRQYHLIQNEHKQHLIKNFKATPKIMEDEKILCDKFQQEIIQIENYSFHCVYKSIFIDKEPKKKYIAYKNIQEYLDIEYYHSYIHNVKSVSEFPQSSASSPKIVRLLNPVDETLTTNFFGLVITDFYFDITGGYIYGALYSSYDNNPKERNISYNPEVIKNINKNLSRWEYLPHSKNFLNHHRKLDE